MNNIDPNIKSQANDAALLNLLMNFDNVENYKKSYLENYVNIEFLKMHVKRTSFQYENR